MASTSTSGIVADQSALTGAAVDAMSAVDVLPPSLDGELLALAQATRYRDWLYSAAAPHIGHRVIEIGAGFGTMTDCVLDRDRVVALELISDYVEQLHHRFDRRENVDIYQGDATDPELWRRMTAKGQLDSAMSFNVMEHIEDDVAVFRNCHDSLVPGGRMVIFTPAFPMLFGAMDEGVGHVRRYRRGELCDKARQAGFRVVDCYYMNLPGFFLWLVNGKLLRSSGAAGGAATVRLFDRWIVPVVRASERCWHPPFGQSLLLVAEKPR